MDAGVHRHAGPEVQLCDDLQHACFLATSSSWSRYPIRSAKHALPQATIAAPARSRFAWIACLRQAQPRRPAR